MPANAILTALDVQRLLSNVPVKKAHRRNTTIYLNILCFQQQSNNSI